MQSNPFNCYTAILFLAAPAMAQSVNFNAPKAYGAGAGNVDSTVVADFNGDGKPDVAVAIQNVGFDILLGNGDGTFQSLPPVTLSLPDGQGVCCLAVGDFNGDG